MNSIDLFPFLTDRAADRRAGDDSFGRRAAQTHALPPGPDTCTVFAKTKLAMIVQLHWKRLSRAM